MQHSACREGSKCTWTTPLPDLDARACPQEFGRRRQAYPLAAVHWQPLWPGQSCPAGHFPAVWPTQARLSHTPPAHQRHSSASQVPCAEKQIAYRRDLMLSFKADRCMRKQPIASVKPGDHISICAADRAVSRGGCCCERQDAQAAGCQAGRSRWPRWPPGPRTAPAAP